MKHIVLATASLALVLFLVLVASKCQRSQSSVPQVQETAAAPDPSTQLVDPKTILFSLPTLCDKLPPTDGQVAEAPSGTFKLHEDDWRQVEFVSATDRGVIEQELAELVQFKAANRAGAGWRNVYVRKSRPNALAPNQISLKQVLQLIGKEIKPSPLLLYSTSTLSAVTGGFAIPIADGSVLYGFTDADRVISLNFHLKDGGIPPDSSQHLLASICRRFSLILVDWYQTAIVLP